MEQRKIVALGKSSLVVSLPKPWLKMNNLGRGDRVSLDILQDGSLVVHPIVDLREEGREMHLYVEADESEDSIIRRVIGSYLDGYTSIKLTSERVFTIGQQRAIRSIVSTLYMMIMESEASSILLQTLIDESKASVISGIERMHIITSSMCRDILNAIRNRDEELASSVVTLENDVDQLMFFLLRLIRCAAMNPTLATQLGLDALDCLDYQTLVHRIERIADLATDIANSVIALLGSKMDIPKDVTSVLIRAAITAFTSYERAVQSFLSGDVAVTNEIIDNQKEIAESFIAITPLPRFGDPDETQTFLHIIFIRESIKKISEYAADIAELTIDRAYKLKNRSFKHTSYKDSRGNDQQCDILPDA